MDRDHVFVESYYQEINNEYVVKADLAREKPRVWYVPHYGVSNPNKPGKVRIVFDHCRASLCDLGYMP